MKCPKCGFISFDYNQVCPRCNKDISAEQQKLNLPAFRPEPPALLGALLGEAGESGMHMSASTEMAVMHEEHEISLGDSAAIESGEMMLHDSQELDLGLDMDAEEATEGISEPEISMEEPSLDLDLEVPADEQAMSGEEAAPELEGISLSDDGGMPELIGGEPGQDQEIALDLGDLSEDAAEKEEESLLASISEEGEKLGIEMEDFSLEEPRRESRAEPEQTGELVMDLDSMPLKMEEPLDLEEKGEITLNLDDLKVNETGELEIGDAVASLAQEEKPLEVEDLPLEPEVAPAATEEKAEEEDFALLLEDEEAVEEPTHDESQEVALDLDNLDLDLDMEDSDRK
ncbi:MAG: hypothetical protein JXL84_08135 [Deltaproteobacteria bacterium]|nr:hypothetical protein [Deltaproteobacteria bacterium]